MQIQHHTIAGHYVQMALDCAAARGLASTPLLDAAGLSEPWPERVPPRQYAELVKAVWQALDDEWAGLSSRPCRRGAFALLAELAIHQATLGEALQLCCRFYRLLDTGVDLQLRQDSEDGWLVLQLAEPARDAGHFLLEFWMVMWCRLAGWLIRARIPLLAAHFCHAAPAHVREYPTLFPCRLHFQQANNALHFASHWLQRPVTRTPEELQVLLAQWPAAFLVKPVFRGSHTQRVRELIARDMANGFPDLDSVAQQFWMTGRTLRRKLLQEGSHYQGIKDDLRRERALQLLASHAHSLHEIALQLGFSEAGAFIRAFKLWTGRTPGQYLAGETGGRVQS